MDVIGGHGVTGPKLLGGPSEIAPLVLNTSESAPWDKRRTIQTREVSLLEIHVVCDDDFPPAKLL